MIKYSVNIELPYRIGMYLHDNRNNTIVEVKEYRINEEEIVTTIELDIINNVKEYEEINYYDLLTYFTPITKNVYKRKDGTRVFYQDAIEEIANNEKKSKQLKRTLY